MNDSRSFPTDVRSDASTSLAGQARPKARMTRRLLATLIIGGTVSLSSSGCASNSMSLASMNPFKGKAADSSIAETTGKLASTTGKVASSGATASKNVFQKASSRVAGLFGGDPTSSDQDDPLSLNSSPEKMEPDVFVANGQLWESTGNLTKAMESYSKALETSPSHEPALTSIARLHFREGNYPKSAEFFQKSISQKPNDAALYNDLGLTLSKLGQHSLAAQTLQRALQLAPGTSRYANNLASVNFESGKTDEALKVLQANNKPAVAHFNMAYLHYKKGQIGQAQAQLNQSLAHEKDATSDPATKRAIDRSREMLAQLSPGSTAPGTAMPGISTPSSTIGPAAGPAAIIAAAPAHKVNQGPQVLGQQMIPTMTPQPKQPVVPGANTPVSYQDPRSFMSPQMPAGVNPQVTVPSFAQPGATPPSVAQPPATVATSPATAASPATTKPAAPATTPSPATPPSSHGFTLPGNFQLPN